MQTKTEEVLFDIFNEFMIVLDHYERFDEDDLVKFMENVSATFKTLEPDVLARYKAYIKTVIDRENERGASERASTLEGLADAVE
jgi:hypothetical protein